MLEVSMNIPWIEQAKIQAQVVVPIVKVLQAELGEERANQIVGKVFEDWSHKLGQQLGARLEGSPVEKVAALMSAFPIFFGDAIDIEVTKLASDVLEFNVTGCRYAEFYKELGMPELGFLVLCSGDFAMAEGLSPDLELTRTQTIMQGASHCDFRYQLKTGETKRVQH